MQIEKRSGKEERRILTGMIVDPIVLGRVSGKWEKGLFRSKWANLIGGWCVKFHSQYGKAPRKAIEGLYEEWAERSNDRDTTKLVEKFLTSLSKEYIQLSKDSNSQHTLDNAANYFSRVKLERLAESVQDNLEKGEINEAQTLVDQFGRVELSSADGVNVLQDKEAIRQAFTSRSDPLLRLPGDLGKFFGSRLERDGFVCFMGPDKRGKSFWLLEIAWRAMLQRRKVGMFEVGDMSQDQVMLRFMSRAAGAPIERGTVMYPRTLRIRRNGDIRINREKKRFNKDLSWQQAWKASQRIAQQKVKSKDPYLRLSCSPSDTVTVADIKAQLLRWEREGFNPDVIVIDYADNLAAMPGIKETRDQINKTWKQLRSLSQERHCLVVTATQSDANAYKARTLGRWNFSEDKRKLAHVTGMVGLNATQEEEDLGVIRLNWIVRREGKVLIGKRELTVAMCLDICNPAVRSTFG